MSTPPRRERKRQKESLSSLLPALGTRRQLQGPCGFYVKKTLQNKLVCELAVLSTWGPISAEELL